MRRCLSLLVAATLLVVACTDTAGPSIERSRVEGAATAAGSGITLDQQNGATGGGEAQQAFMLKGFNPTNPHRGDAIVATFMWFGSTNVITAVTDHLANGTPVGNTYTLVEYVTAGGVSMATYVATNVQNFPDPYGVPGGAQDSILVVEATMSQAASDGAIQISAWSGVAATQAVGAHRSASGAAASQTVADPGAITVGAGAVAIGVTLSNGVAGVQTPAGWTQIGQGSDASMKNDGEYLVSASGGSVDPQWQWFFGAQSTWLATVFALNSATSSTNQPPTAAFTSSCSNLSCTFTNSSTDPDGTIANNSWTFGDGATSTAQNPSHSYGAGGTYTVTLTVTDNQGATNSVSHSVTVSAANQSPTAAFTSSCSNLSCTFTNSSSDPDGTIASNSWTFGDGGTSTAQSPSHSYAAGGTYTVTLTVTDNQGATNSVSHSVTVTAPNQPPVAGFTSSCSSLSCNFTSTSSDPDGSISAYSWTFGDGGTSTVQSPSHSYAAGGTYTVTLKVTDNQGATNTVSHSVTVTAPNTAPVVNAGADQTVLLGVLYTLNASFSDPDNGPWTYTINWGDGSSSSGSKSSPGTISAGHTYLGILTNRTITVTVTDSKGASGSDSKVITLIL